MHLEVVRCHFDPFVICEIADVCEVCWRILSGQEDHDSCLGVVEVALMWKNAQRIAWGTIPDLNKSSRS